MKKAALFLGIIFVVGASVVSWKLLHSGPIAATQLLPINTIAFVEIPDVPSATEHWKKSELCNLVSEPEIQAFLSRPLDRLYEKSGLLTNKITPKIAMELLLKVKPGRFFAALEPSPKEVGWIVGCQFFGSQTSMEESLLRVTQMLDARLGAGNELVLKTEEHHGDLIKKRTYLSLVLYVAFHGNWCFVSDDLEALQKTLDLCADRSLKKEALATSSLYQQNHHQLFSQADLFCYFTQHPTLQKLPYFSALYEDQFIKLAKATGASFRFIEEGVEEKLFFSGDFKINEEISHHGLRFTQATTLGFIERINDWKQIVERIKTNPALPPHLASFLATSGLDLSSLAALLKSEMTFAIDWVRGNSLPSILLVAPEADSEKIVNWLDQTAPQLGTTVQASDQNDLLMVSMPKIASAIQPTFASAKGSFFVSSDPAAIKQINNRNAATPTLETAPYFAKNAALYREANEAFFYFSSKEIFERAYELARPSLLVGSAFFPQAKTIIDFSRLPATQTVAKHLPPVIIAQSHHENGFLIQSRGPLSATPLFLIGRTLFQTFFLKQGAPPANSIPNATNQNELVPAEGTAAPI